MKKEPKNPYEKKLGDNFRPKKRANAKTETKALANKGFTPVVYVQVTSSPLKQSCIICGSHSHDLFNCKSLFIPMNSQFNCRYCGGSHAMSNCPAFFGLSGYVPGHGSTITSTIGGNTISYYTTNLYEDPETDKTVPTTLGWRGWIWDEISQRLLSPVFGIPWDAAECRADMYDPVEDIRNKRGIHAYLVPKNWKMHNCETMHFVLENYRIAGLVKESFSSGSRFKSYISTPQNKGHHGPPRLVEEIKALPVHGIVERFGQFQVGEIGWRSEWAVIRELLAPNREVGLKLERMFPEVKVHFPEEKVKPDGDFGDWIFDWKFK